MCQPGRPLPHGLSHDGSPAFAPFQSAKSGGVLLLLAGLDARAGEQRVLRAMRELAVVVLRGDAVVDVRPLALRRRGLVRVALLDQAAR